MLRNSLLVALFALFAAEARTQVKITSVDGDRCTTIVLGKLAGVGGPMTTHTADCSECDFRLNKVPAKDHLPGSMRALYEYKGDYPATIASDRGKTWHPDNLEGSDKQKGLWGTVSKITGYIPEVSGGHSRFSFTLTDPSGVVPYDSIHMRLLTLCLTICFYANYILRDPLLVAT